MLSSVQRLTISRDLGANTWLEDIPIQYRRMFAIFLSDFSVSAEVIHTDGDVADTNIRIPSAKSGHAMCVIKKPKNVRIAGECTKCGAHDNPRWRPGPDGPRTLYTACHNRRVRREKKQSGLPEKN